MTNYNFVCLKPKWLWCLCYNAPPATMKLAAAARPAKLDVRSLTKANLDASGVADASPLSARSKLRRFASTSDLPPAIQPPRMKKRHSIAVSADDDYADYHAHNLRHVDALHGDLLYLPADATAAKVVYSHETLAMCILCIIAGVGAVAPATLIVDAEPSAMQLVMLGNYLYMILYSLVVQPRVLFDHEIPIRTHLRLVVAQFAYMQGQNIAFRLGMPMSIVLVLKNGGLVAQMLVGTFLLGERYHLRQILAAAAVTIGIIISVRGDAPSDSGAAATTYGVVLPTAVLVLATLLRSLGNEWTKRSTAASSTKFCSSSTSSDCPWYVPSRSS